MAEKVTTPEVVTIQCVDPEEANPVLHLEPEPIVFKDGKAEMKKVLADILLADKGNVYKDADNGKFYPKFKLVK